MREFGKPSAEQTASSVSSSASLTVRGGILFVNFFLIILAYYHIKPASRSLFLEHLGADWLPYIWIATALSLGALIGYYNRLVSRHTRLHVVLGSCLLFALTLVGFRYWLQTGGAPAAAVFYVFVDIFSVVLVEQFWSLTNSVYSTHDGKRWYGFVGTGGLLGGVLGGTVAAFLLNHTNMHTEDLLLVSTGLLAVIFAVNVGMGRLGIFAEGNTKKVPVSSAEGWRAIVDSRYLTLIAVMLVLAQLASPMVEYQFVKSVESAYRELDARTAFFSQFFSILGLVSIAVNLVLTPLIHRYLGVVIGLLTQPLVLGITSSLFNLQPTLIMGAVMKIADRGLSYSINRASKELLYVPVDPVQAYQAKAWIDMFGYRVFKVLGSLTILLLTQWLSAPLGIAGLSWFVIACCLVWMLAIFYLSKEYRSISGPLPAPAAA